MLNSLRRWLTPPSFPDSDIRTRRASLLNYILLAFIGLVLFILIGALAGGRTPPSVLITTLLTLAVGLILRAWLRRGGLTGASLGLLVVGLGIVIADIILLGTVRVPVTSVLLLLVMTAGLLFDLGGMIIMTVICSLLVAGLIGAENAGWLPRPDVTMTITQWATYTAIFAWAGSLMYAALRLMNRALARAERELHERQHAETALRQAQVELERRVEERTVELMATGERLQQELTERQQAEEALRQSEEQYRSLFENMTEGFALHDLALDTTGYPCDYRFLRVNPAFEQITGLTRENLVGQRQSQVMPNEDPFWFETYRQVALTGEPIRLEHYSTALQRHYEVFAYRPAPNQFAVIFSDITERKQAEDALRESEAKYRRAESELRQAQSVAHLGNWKWDLRTQEVSWSDEMYRIFGLDQHSYTGRLGGAIQKVIHPDDLHLVLPSNAATFLDNQPVEYRIICPDGSIRHIWAVSGEAILDTAGRPIFLTGIAQDVTERKQAEEALRQTNAYLENLINYANAPIIVWDPHFHITRFNHAFEFLTGRTETEVVGQSLEILFPPELADQSMTLIRKTLTGERWETVEIKIQHRDGSVRTVLWNSATIFAANGHTPQATIAQGQDITERKRTEEELRKSEAEHRSLLDSQESNILVLDFDGVHHYVNQVSIGSFTGATTPQDILGKRLHDLYPAHTADWQLEQIRRVMTTGQGVSGDYENVVDNQSSWWHLNLQPIRNASGQVAQVMVNSLDITERKRLEAALRELNGTLEQRVADRTTELQAANVRLTELDRLKDEFLSRISHELRTPLAGILIALELLDTAQPEKRERFMLRLKQSAERLRDMIEDVLLFSQLNLNTAPAGLESINLNNLIEGHSTTWQKLSAGHDLQLQLDLARDLPYARIDRELIGLVISRLVTNAVNYTPTGSVVVSTASVDEGGQSWVIVRVKDTGPGITPEDLPHIFERFYRGRAAADYKTPGTGIGLSISREVVQKMGGQLTVETQVGVGSTFTVWLPA